MKKSLLVAASVALLGGSAMAQLPDYSICPDWTGTDLNGNTHNLYSLLDSGYTVIIDVSATWCGPCWSYHNTHAIRNLYDTYGPGTAENKVRAFFIEGDASTTLADLQGNTAQTQGDWIDGTTYPIIDNASIANLLEITYFPTIYKVCPNRVITEVGQIPTTQLWNSVGSCQEAMTGTDAGLLPSMGSITGCAGSDVGLTARLQNLGTQPLTSATIQARLGTTVLGSTNWTGNLDTYEVEDVTVANFAPTGSSNITLEITTADGNAANNTASQLVTASTSISGTNATFKVKGDQYASETTWKLFNSSNAVVEQGGPYTNGTTQTEHVYDWTLDDMECYRLEVYDAYGDGMCCSYGQGYFKLEWNGIVVLQGGQFGASTTKNFLTNNAVASVGSNELERSLNVYPNPTSGLVNLEYNLEQGTAMKLMVTDVLGKVVMEQTLNVATGLQRETINLGTLGNGMYLLKLDAGKYQATRTVTVNK